MLLVSNATQCNGYRVECWMECTTATLLVESGKFNASSSLCCREQRKMLEKCAMTALSSKLISQQKFFFARMVVNAVMMLDELLQLKMIGIKKVQGGALEVSLLGPP